MVSVELDKELEGAFIEKRVIGRILGILSDPDLWIWIWLFKRVGSGLELSLSTFSKDPELKFLSNLF